VEYRSPAPIIAFVLAAAAGVLIATGDYIAGAALGGAAVLVGALWTYALRRGDDDRHTLW
jgi:hypothetical protein